MGRFVCSGTVALLFMLAVSPAWAQTENPAAPALSSPMQALLASRIDHAPSILASAERIAARTPLEKVRQDDDKDSVRNGIVIGAVIGGVTTFGFISSLYIRCLTLVDTPQGGDACDLPQAAHLVPLGTLAGTGVGALIGYLVDRAR